MLEPTRQRRWTIYPCPTHGVHSNSGVNNWCQACGKHIGEGVRVAPVSKAQDADRLAEAASHLLPKLEAWSEDENNITLMYQAKLAVDELRAALAVYSREGSR